MIVYINGVLTTVDGLKIRIMPLTSGKCFWYIYPYRNNITGGHPFPSVASGKSANENAAKRKAEEEYWHRMDESEGRNPDTRSYSYVPERNDQG